MATENIRPIVVGMDGSAGSIEALRWAVAYAQCCGAPVEALMSWQLPEVYAYTSREYEADARDRLRVAIEAALDPAERSLVTPRVAPGRAGHVLIEASKEAVLLVVGSHGHSDLVGRLLGSVSEHCVHNAQCPVVVVRHTTRPTGSPPPQGSGASTSAALQVEPGAASPA